MARKLTGRLEAPTRGRPNYSLRIRVNGKHRRFDLGTADPVAAAQERDRVIASIEADREQKGANGRAHESVQRVRRVVVQARKDTRTFPSVAERFWERQKANGVRTWKEQKSALERFVLPHFTGDVSRYNAQAVLSVLDGVELAYKSRLNILVAISGVFELAVLTGLIDSNPCKQVKRTRLVAPRAGERDAKTRTTPNADEVAAMLKWEHPEERHREATERLQDKLLVAYFLGLRHHEIAALRWEDFDSRADEEGFQRVTIYRAKKKNPADRLDTLDLSELGVLQDSFRRRWQSQKRPSTGLVFPAVRDGEHAEAGKSGVRGLSEAANLRTCACSTAARWALMSWSRKPRWWTTSGRPAGSAPWWSASGKRFGS